jgi:hypothetical protein
MARVEPKRNGALVGSASLVCFGPLALLQTLHPIVRPAVQAGAVRVLASWPEKSAVVHLRAIASQAEAEAQRIVAEAQALADRILYEATHRTENIEVVTGQLRTRRRAARAELRRLIEIMVETGWGESARPLLSILDMIDEILTTWATEEVYVYSDRSVDKLEDEPLPF